MAMGIPWSLRGNSLVVNIRTQVSNITLYDVKCVRDYEVTLKTRQCIAYFRENEMIILD